jgi:hypothetical protein
VTVTYVTHGATAAGPAAIRTYTINALVAST